MIARLPQWLRSDDAGSVTAEFAVTLPAALLVLGVGVAALSAGALGVRLQDAAADAARLLGRGEDPSAAHAIVRAADGELSVEQRGDLVCATATAIVSLGPIETSIPLSAVSCALSGGR